MSNKTTVKLVLDILDPRVIARLRVDPDFAVTLTDEMLTEIHNLRASRNELAEACRILLVQIGEYRDGDGAAKFHAINIGQRAIAGIAAQVKGNE